MTEYANTHGGVAVPKTGVKKTSSKANKKRAYQQEVRLAKQTTEAGMPATRVALSGALKGVGLDGDVNAAWWLAEAKSYSTVEVNGEKYIRFPVSWIDKIMDEGKLHDKPGIVVLQPKGAHNAFVVVDRDQFIALMGKAYKALHGEEPK